MKVASHYTLAGPLRRLASAISCLTLVLLAVGCNGAQNADAAASPTTRHSALAVAQLGTGAVLVVGAARNLAKRRRGHPCLPAAERTDPLEIGFHREILASANTDARTTLEVGLATLAGPLRDGQTHTAPLVVQHGSGHLDVYVDPPAPPPPGWTTSDDAGAIWTAGTTEGAPSSGAPPTCPAPLLVTLGRADDDGQLYLDLEAA